jgi:hypothetical protein
VREERKWEMSLFVFGSGGASDGVIDFAPLRAP